jgi:hypothetical protein
VQSAEALNAKAAQDKKIEEIMTPLNNAKLSRPGVNVF